MESEEGKGSTFSVYLPADYTRTAEPTPAPVNVQKEGMGERYPTLQNMSVPDEMVPHMKHVLEGKTILITDDDMRNVIALQMVLGSYGPHLLIASNGNEAMEILQGHAHVDMVLMDLMMPEMDGFETIRAIRQNSRYKGLPIIVLTAKTMISDQEKSIAAGASDYLAKPVDVMNLLSVMEMWLSKKKEYTVTD